MKQEVTTDNTEKQTITKDYCEQLAGQQTGTSKKHTTFQDWFTKIEHLNSLTISNEIEEIIKKLSIKVQDQMAPQVNFTKHLEY